ncbi:Ser-Thr-rich glycosyl-phosphatidyl-inositol-anchored membrane family-domain-containing protein [Ilyonectria sp. MPI-CAGE-AT-0026]|nr:Ser-Thr-rich glycosyl-phosphatidyl-inositol-anchored membrane family-domain-containing protein [Ilyonectria sp. MPI-CAGE-AT-0026]
MQFHISAAAVLAFVASAFAQTADFDPVNVPAAWEVIPAGSSFTIQWTAPAKYSGETISISLIGGATQGTQVPLQDIASGIDNDAGSYAWAVPASLGDAAVYGLVIKLDSDTSVFQYSNPFKIDGDAAEETTSEAPAQVISTVTADSSYVLPTVSSEAPADYTIVIPVVETTTVPCNSTTPAPYAPPVATTIIDTCHGNCTWSTAVVPPVTTTGGAYPNSPSTTPAATVVTGASARFGAGSMVVVGGLVIAALAL